MSDKVEWELMDGERSAGWNQAGSRNAPPSLQDAMHALLGRWWRWKIFAGAVTVGLMLALLAMAAGVVVLVAATLAAVALVTAKIRQLLSKSSGTVTHHGH